MYKAELDAYIDGHKDEMLQDIMELIRIPSVKSEAGTGAPFGKENARVLKKVGEILEGYGFSVENHENYVVTADMSERKTEIDILAHMDVVSAEGSWQVTEPFSPVIRDGRLYGRGAADDKGPAMAAIYAMRAVKECGIPLAANVRLILGADEESGSDDIAYYYKKENPAPMTLSPDAQFPLVNIEKGILHGIFKGNPVNYTENPVIKKINAGAEINVIPGAAEAIVFGVPEEALQTVCRKIQEKTGLQLVMERKEENFEVLVKGTACHASLPENGENALTGLLELLADPLFEKSEVYPQLSALHRFFPHGDWTGRHLGAAMEDEISGSVEINLTRLFYENGQLEGGFDSRTPLCATNENFRDVIAAKLKAAGLELGERPIYAPHHVPEESEFVQTLLDCYEMYSGRRGKPLTIGGGSYVHAVPNGVAFGCAELDVDNHMHGDDEFADIEQLVRSAKIYAQAIVRLCGKGEEQNV